MQSEIVTSDQQRSPTPLGERLDASIGETSSGIGALLSELVRRSLRAGVSDIGESLVEFAEEKVEQAVQQQMPGIAEAADAVAQSTSKRVVSAAVEELKEQSTNQQQLLESKITAAESSAFDRSRSHIQEVVSEVRESIDETRTLAVNGTDQSERKIQELREKAKRNWLKLKNEFVAINEAHQSLCQQHTQQHTQLREELLSVQQRYLQYVESTEQKHSALVVRNQRLEERLAVLEQPRGIRGLFAKLRSGRKATSPQDTDIADETNPVQADD